MNCGKSRLHCAGSPNIRCRTGARDRSGRCSKAAGPAWTKTDLVLAMSNPRAVRYRRLALQEPDSERAKLLRAIAEEAERGVLCTAEWIKPKTHVESPVGGSRA